MASCDLISLDASLIIDEILNKQKCADHLRERRVCAAIIIQSFWRGTQARRKIRNFHQAATKIQKWLHTCQVFSSYSKIFSEFHYLKQKAYYDKCAVKIQALWRGYAYRKRDRFHREYTHNQKIVKENLKLRRTTEMKMKKVKFLREKATEEEAKLKVMDIVSKMHYRLRTCVQEGIYSQHGSNELSSIEQVLASVKFTDQVKNIRKEYYKDYKNQISYYKVPNLKIEQKNCIEIKRFSFDPRIEKKYETALKSSEPFQDAAGPIFRDLNPDKNICSKDFDLTKKKISPKSNLPPYILDVRYNGRTGCKFHDIKL